MGVFDEMIEMGEAVEKLGDKPPEIKPDPVPESDGEATPEPTPEPEDVLSGGLGQPLEQEDESVLTVDQLLGLEDEVKSEDAPKQDEQDETPPEPEKEPKPGSMDERIRELTARNKKLEEDRDRFVERELGKGDGAPAEKTPGEPELDPDVLEYFKTYSKAALADDLSEIRNDLRPMKDQTHNDQLAGVINDHVDFDFKASDMAALYKEMEGMSEQDQAFYKDGVPAAVLLADKLHSRGALGGEKEPQKRTANLSSRHHSESTGAPPRDPGAMGDEEKARRLLAMDDNEILAILDRLEE